MKIIGNIIWVIFGGLILALEYAICGLIWCITIIGIPFGIQLFKCASLALWPFGREVRNKQNSTGCLSTGMNVLWFLLGGIWLALEHVIAGKAVAFKEALDPSFKEYQSQIVKNCKALANSLRNKGFNMVTGGTDNHLLLLDLTNFDITGKELQNRCDNVYITLNKNAIPNDPRSPFVTSGVRIGTAAITSRGMKEEDMEIIADLIYQTVTDYENNIDNIREKVVTLCNKYPIYEN